MCATPADRVRREIKDAYRGAAPGVLRPFLADPEAAVARLADLIREYWRRALAPHWDRLRGVLEGDVVDADEPGHDATIAAPEGPPGDRRAR